MAPITPLIRRVRAWCDRGASVVGYALLVALVATVAGSSLNVLGERAEGSVDRAGGAVADKADQSFDESGAVVTPTTVAPTTTTTRPIGVPRWWPKDREIPEMPFACERPRLRRNGTWVCRR